MDNIVDYWMPKIKKARRERKKNDEVTMAAPEEEEGRIIRENPPANCLKDQL